MNAAPRAHPGVLWCLALVLLLVLPLAAPPAAPSRAARPREVPTRRGTVCHPRPPLDPARVYRVDVDGYPSVGPADAPITIVVVEDYASGFARKLRPAIEALRAEHPDDVRVVYRQFIVHPQWATLPARAICAAARQGKFAEMDPLLWGLFPRDGGKSDAEIRELAAQAGLDLARYDRDMRACAEAELPQQRDLWRLRLREIPTTFINGRPIEGAVPAAQLEALLDDQLRAVRRARGESFPLEATLRSLAKW